jgi:hypothetical protein
MTLEMATIKPLEPSGQAEIKAMFNPDHIIYTKTNTWNLHRTNGQNLPEVAFASGTPATLQVTLIFDGTEDGENIAKIVNKLTALTKVDKSLKGRRSNAQGGDAPSNSFQGRPPTVQFHWGSYLSFDAVIKQITSKFTMFLDDGTPVRASVDVTFMQIADEDAFPSQNPTSGGRTGERIHRLGPRETLDQVAYAAFGRTGLWRGLAAFNGIDDPLRLQAGDAILLPASADDLKALS